MYSTPGDERNGALGNVVFRSRRHLGGAGVAVFRGGSGDPGAAPVTRSGRVETAAGPQAETLPQPAPSAVRPGRTPSLVYGSGTPVCAAPER